MAETPKDAGDRNRSLSEGSETEFELEYAPIITLPEIPVCTNEEDEEVMLKLRAKLYRFDTKHDESPEWKERGTGEIKLLKHKENKTVRIVMRRDKTFKVCANHFITPALSLKPSIGSEKAFIYTVAGDFADEQIKSECLAIRFGTVEFANQFQEKFNEAKEYVAKECSLYNGKSDSFSEDEGVREDSDDVREDSEGVREDGENDESQREEGDEKDTELSQKLSQLDVGKPDDPKNSTAQE